MVAAAKICTARFDANDQNRGASGAGGELMIVSRVDADGVECEEKISAIGVHRCLTSLRFCCGAYVVTVSEASTARDPEGLLRLRLFGPTPR